MIVHSRHVSARSSHRSGAGVSLMAVVVRLEVVASFEGGSYSLLLISTLTVDLVIHCTNLIACSPSARILLAAWEIIVSQESSQGCLPPTVEGRG